MIYDITDRNSFKNLPNWLEKIREFSDEHVQVALVGNKLDLTLDGKNILIRDPSKTIFDGTQAASPEFKKSLFKELIEDGEVRVPQQPRMEAVQYEGGSPDTQAGLKRSPKRL